MLSRDFLAQFKHVTEERWRKRSINPHIYGFQFQPGTRWNPGLSADQVAEYENVLDVRFPNDFRTFLQAMNGTDLPTLNVYGYSGEPSRTSIGVYSFPTHVELIRRLMKEVQEEREALRACMAEQGFDLPGNANLVPIYGHRYIVCTSDLNLSVVLSIDGGDDAIMYGNSFQEYLQREFL